MTTLKDILLTPQARPEVIADCINLIDSEVAHKHGLSGLAIKGAYAVVKKIKPSIIHDAVDALLNDFVAQLEPFYQTYIAAKATDITAFMQQRHNAIAQALLGITDAKISHSSHKTIKSAYEKLRPMALKHVEQAIPGTLHILEKFISPS